MFRELLSIFRSKDVLAEMGENFTRMLQLAHEMNLTAGAVFFGKKIPQQERDYLYQQDIRVNQSERSIRKQVVAHLSIQGNRLDVPYCLLLMSLVKDVERHIRELRPRRIYTHAGHDTNVDQCIPADRRTY